MYLIEACVENYHEAFIAQERGAHQIELCRRLDLDGLTPLISEVRLCLKKIDIPIKVMIRPDAGNFITNQKKLKKMSEEILAIKSLGVKSVVIGLTSSLHRLDIEAIQELIMHARPMNITIHKAIDTCEDIIGETRRLLSLNNIDSILTSGGAVSALIGAATIKDMISIAGDKLQIIAAGGITNENLDEVHKEINSSAYHGRNIVGPLQ